MGVKILFCDNSLRDLLNFRGEIIRYYASRGIEVILLAPQTQEYIPEDSHIRYIPVQLNRSGMNPFKEIAYIKTLYQIYKKEKPDYIFHYTIKPNIYGTLIARVLGLNSVLMITGFGYVFQQKGIGCFIARNLYRLALKCSKYIFVLNSENKDFLLKNKIVPITKIIHLQGGEGINLEHFHEYNVDSSKNKIVFLMVARLLYDKGYTEYIEATKIIKKHYSNAEFYLLGAIDTTRINHVTEEQVKKDQICGNIHYIGFKPDVIPWMQLADCIVLPSYHEGLSRVLIEAIAMGKPVIASNISGCRETVDDGINGFLVPPRDKIALADAMQRFLNLTEDKRCEMGKNSRKKAEVTFDISRVIEKYEVIISELYKS